MKQKREDILKKRIIKDKNHKGYDIISKNKDGKIVRRIEVKGSEKEKGIPDCFQSELKDGKFVGTHLYVVRFLKKQEPKFYIIPKKEIDKYKHTRVYRWRLSSTLKTGIDKFRVDSL